MKNGVPTILMCEGRRLWICACGQPVLSIDMRWIRCPSCGERWRTVGKLRYALPTKRRMAILFDEAVAKQTRRLRRSAAETPGRDAGLITPEAVPPPVSREESK